MWRNYKDPQYQAWRKKVFARDKYKCQWPGCKCRKKLAAHHIMKWADYPSLRLKVSNGITLCEKHHKQVDKQEGSYAELLTKIIRKKIKRLKYY